MDLIGELKEFCNINDPDQYCGSLELLAPIRCSEYNQLVSIIMKYGWHDVSELPEANKGVLASLNGGVVRAVYVPPFTNTDLDYEGDDVVYNEENDEYYWPEGWYEWNLYDDMHYRINEPVIAWMPLPESYKKEE